MQLSQKTFGQEFLPTLEVDARLLLDCSFVGLPAKLLSSRPGNLSGFEPNREKHWIWRLPGNTQRKDSALNRTSLITRKSQNWAG